MRWCLRVKLAQHYEEFGRLLLATEDRPIVEQSRKDDYWGAKVVDVADDETLIGQNVLGRLLMELRELLKSDAAGTLKTVLPLAIPDFLLLGKPIETVTDRMGELREQPCVLCENPAKYRSADHGNRKHFYCPVCSEYQITHAAEAKLEVDTAGLRPKLAEIAASLDAEHVLVVDVPNVPRRDGVAYESLRGTPIRREELPRAS